MTKPVIKNRTSSTDLKNFLELINFIYKYCSEVKASQMMNDYEEVLSIIDEVASGLDVKSSEVTDFLDSAYELLNSLSESEDLYENSLGKFYYEQFKPTTYTFFGQTKMKTFKEGRLKLLSAHDSSAMLVLVADNIQHVLANMEILESLSNKINKNLVEHNCIVRNEIGFKIAYIELLFVFIKTGIPSNLYWIESDSMNPNEAILKETIGHASSVFEISATPDKGDVFKKAA